MCFLVYILYTHNIHFKHIQMFPHYIKNVFLYTYTKKFNINLTY
jgi:hypothetical protein